MTYYIQLKKKKKIKQFAYYIKRSGEKNWSHKLSVIKTAFKFAVKLVYLELVITGIVKRNLFCHYVQ